MMFSARQPRRLSATVRNGFSTNAPSATSTTADRCRQRQASADAVEKVGAELFREVFMGRFTPNQDSRAACRPI